MKCFIVPALAMVFATGVANAASIKWQPSFDTAVKMARTSNRLVMVDFYTDWCGWCKKLDADTYESNQIVSKSAGFVPVKINAEKEGVAQAKKYHVDGFPTILFLKPNGDVAWKIVGYMPPADFAKQMDLANGVTTELPRLEAKYASTKADPTLDSKLLSYYSGQGNLVKVAAVFDSLKSCPQDHNKEALGSGYNAAGDAFQNGNKFEEAVKAFKMAEAVGTPSEVVYARISLATCAMSTGQKETAVAALKSLLAMGPEADVYRTQAQAMLDSLEKSSS